MKTDKSLYYTKTADEETTQVSESKLESIRRLQEIEKAIKEIQIEEEQKLNSSSSNIKAVLFAILSLVLFFGIRVLVALLLALVFGLILQIPILGKLIFSVINSIGNSSTWLISVASIFTAGGIVLASQEKFIRNENACSLTRKVFGFSLTAIHIVWLIANLIFDYSIAANVLCIATGLFVAFELSN